MCILTCIIPPDELKLKIPPLTSSPTRITTDFRYKLFCSSVIVKGMTFFIKSSIIIPDRVFNIVDKELGKKKTKN